MSFKKPVTKSQPHSFKDKAPMSIERMPLLPSKLPEAVRYPQLNCGPNFMHKVFPKWEVNFPSDHWHCASSPFVDTIEHRHFRLPLEIRENETTKIQWIRPSEFSRYKSSIPVIADIKTSHSVEISSSESEIRGKSHNWQVFTRRWGADQLRQLQVWEDEERRVDSYNEKRERNLLIHEESLSYALNDRSSQRFVHDLNLDIDVTELIDSDEEDREDGRNDKLSRRKSLERMRNTFEKPYIPSGRVVHAEMTSYFQIIEKLFREWIIDAVDAAQSPPYLWEAIHPQDARKIPIYNPGGKYSVKMHVMGSWRRVDIDDRLPVDASNHLIYASTASEEELWPALLSKAVAKVFYYLLRSGSETAFDEFTCISYVFQLLTSCKVTPWNALALGEAARSFLRNEMDNDIVQGHAASTRMTPRMALCGTKRASNEAPLQPLELALVQSMSISDDKKEIRCLHQDGNDFCMNEVHNSLSPFDGDYFAVLLHPPSASQDVVSYHYELDPTHKCGELQDKIDMLPADPNRVLWIRRTNEGLPLTSSDDNNGMFTDIVLTLWKFPLQIPDDGENALSVDEEHQPFLLTNEAFLNVDQQSDQAEHIGIVSLHSSRSHHLRLSKTNDHVMWLRTQLDPAQGYIIQAEIFNTMDNQILFMELGDYWKEKNLKQLHVEGISSVLQSRSWSILLHQQVQMKTADIDIDALFFNFYVSKVDIASNIQLLFVEQEGSKQITFCPLLYGNIVLGRRQGADSPYRSFDVIIKCYAPGHNVQPFQWSLDLASVAELTTIATHVQFVQTRFCGPYVANRDRILFRDCVHALKNPHVTFARLEIVSIKDDAEGISDQELEAISVTAELQILDLESDRLLCSERAFNAVEVGPLPSLMKDKGECNVVIQAIMHVSENSALSELTARVPYNSSFSLFETKEGAADAQVDFRRDLRESAAQPNVRWILSIVSLEAVKLVLDLRKERQYSLLYEMWKKEATKRERHGEISRLLYLSKLDLAQQKINEAHISEETAERIKKRVQTFYKDHIQSNTLTIVEQCKSNEIIQYEEEELLSKIMLNDELETKRKLAHAQRLQCQINAHEEFIAQSNTSQSVFRSNISKWQAQFSALRV